MKVTYLLLLNLLFLFSNCKTQDGEPKGYSLKKEYGLKGPVKELISYMCKAEGENIPVDTANFFGKYRLTFDQNGNVIEDFKRTKNENGTDIVYRLLFSAKGKNISYDESGSIDGKEIEKSHYEYIWLDDLHYKIAKKTDGGYSVLVTLDKDYKAIKNQLKQTNLEVNTTYENLIKNNRVEKMKAFSTVSNGETKKNVNVFVMKGFDSHNNPTLIYTYDNLEEKKPTAVIFKKYKYY